MREKVTPGTSALFALISGAPEDRMIEELRQYDFEIMGTALVLKDFKLALKGGQKAAQGSSCILAIAER